MIIPIILSKGAVMQLNHLKYFISVAEHLNFTEAAKHLFVAQSAVSQQIAYLESELGVRLFERNKRSVQLTNAGIVFLKEAIDIIKKTEEAAEKARKADAGIIGSLKIGFLAAPVRRLLPQIIRQFNSKYPAIEIKLNHLNLSRLNEELKNNDVDLVFAISMGFQDIEDLEYISLFSESCCVFINHKHPFAQNKSINLEELSQESFVFRDRAEAPQWYDFALSLCAKNGFSPHIVSHNPRIETVLMLVDAGLGVAILPSYLRMYANPTISIINLDGEIDTIDIVVYHKLTNKNPALPLFLNEIHSLLQHDHNDFSTLSI